MIACEKIAATRQLPVSLIILVVHKFVSKRHQFPNGIDPPGSNFAKPQFAKFWGSRRGFWLIRFIFRNQQCAAIQVRDDSPRTSRDTTCQATGLLPPQRRPGWAASDFARRSRTIFRVGSIARCRSLHPPADRVGRAPHRWLAASRCVLPFRASGYRSV